VENEIAMEGIGQPNLEALGPKPLPKLIGLDQAGLNLPSGGINFNAEAALLKGANHKPVGKTATTPPSMPKVPSRRLGGAIAEPNNP
jgi:hypothetical protein